jgi:catechol 2,3-dioxygenase-like lactoylglutathione lyase family enzyme
MKIKAIGFVGIPVTDVKRAREFYEGVLGLKVSEEMMGGRWIEYTRHLIRGQAPHWRSKISMMPSSD